MKSNLDLKYLSTALVDCAIIIAASISENWWLLLLLILNNIDTTSN